MLSQHKTSKRLWGGSHLGWLLAFIVLFASVHVALHGLDDPGNDPRNQHECKVCRLNHVSAASLPIPSLVLPLVALRQRIVAPRIQTPRQAFYQAWRARAPPPV